MKETMKAKEILVDQDRFDAVLRKIIATKPMPLKDVVGTSQRQTPKRKKKSRI